MKGGMPESGLSIRVSEYNVVLAMAWWLRIVFLLIAGTAYLPGQEQALLELYKEARSAEQSGDYSTATRAYERIVALRPDMAEAHSNLGNLYYIQGRSDQALASFRKAIRLKPGLSAPHVLLGVLHFKGREFDKAVLHLNSAAKLGDANPLVPLYQGYTHFALGKYEDSASFLENVIELEPRNVDAWYHLSKAYGQLSKRNFETLQKQHPNSFYTHLARSRVFESGGNWEEAREELAKALAREPHRDSVKQRIEWLGRKSAGETTPPPAADDIASTGSTKYLYSPPEGSSILLAYKTERSRVGSFDGRKLAAVSELYEQADGYQALSFLSSLWLIVTDPDSYRAHQLRGQSLEAAAKLDEAIEAYRKALALKPDLLTVHFAIGNLYWRRAQLDDALPELEKELKLNPDDAQAHYEIGDIHLTQNRAEEAEKHFLHALKVAPAMPEAWLALARIVSARGESIKAISYLKKVSEISPDDPTPHYRLWLLYRKIGNTEAAQKERKLFDQLRGKTREIRQEDRF